MNADAVGVAVEKQKCSMSCCANKEMPSDMKMDGSKQCAEWTAGDALMQEQESPLSTYEPVPSRRLGRSMGINN